MKQPCAQWQELLATPWLEDELSPAEYKAFEIHIAQCVECATTRQRYHMLISSLQGRSVVIPLPSTFSQQIRLKEEAARAKSHISIKPIPVLQTDEKTRRIGTDVGTTGKWENDNAVPSFSFLRMHFKAGLLLCCFLTVWLISLAGIVPSALNILSRWVIAFIGGLVILSGLNLAFLQRARSAVIKYWREARRHRVLVILISIVLAVLAAGGSLLASSLLSPKKGNQPELLYFYHLSPNTYVNNVVWSPNGKYLASSNGDGTAWVIDTADNGLFTYRYRTESLNGVVWSPDGGHIALASADGTVQVWDPITGSTSLIYRGQSGSIWSVAWSPDGKRIASASDNGTVQVWDATDGGNILTYRAHSSVQAVRWSPDGRYIASGSQDGTVQVWDALTGHTIDIYRGHTGEVYSVDWSPDGKRIASGSQDGTIQIWAAIGT